ncbi:MAG: heavy metal transport/detoxification protein [Candidatus Peregrinibacteria bacterium Greene0416_19]|nr:MAG: heavy metal transport/detoxification protein [Candidatus Peregrinibacteria bacterium Greene0416_19]
MTCRSCELLIERLLKALPGVTEVFASERKGHVEVLSDARLPAPSLGDLQAALEGRYRLRPSNGIVAVRDEPPGTQHWLEVGGMLVLIVALFLILRKTGIVTLSATTEGIVSLTAVFTIGLVAALSTCLAVVGGLLLSVSAKWNESFHPTSRWDKFRPLLLFNAGRLAGYFLLGGLLGVVGSTLTLSTRLNGLVTIIVAIIMVILGLNILKVLPKRYCTLPLPRWMKDRIRRVGESRSPLAPLLLGALTFFLPCGFTQSMQALALTIHDPSPVVSFFQGGMIMFVFALGTLPSLLGISIVSSVAEGKAGRRFLTFAGTLAVFLGLLNLRSGLLLTDLDPWSILPVTASAGQDPNVTIDARGRQIIRMYVTDEGYAPDSFTIDPSRDTWIYANAPRPISGCASFMAVPALNQSRQITVGDNWLALGKPTRNFVITCSMGMMRADVRMRAGSS